MNCKISAWRRPWSAQNLTLEDYPELAASRAFSVAKLAELAELAQPLCALAGLESLVVAGSLGRLEAMPDSDCDLMVIVGDDVAQGSAQACEILEAVWLSIAPAGLKRPKNWGIFTQAASGRALTDPAALGALDDDPNLFGKRMQLLLDSQAFFGEQAFCQLKLRLIRWFMTAAVARDREFPFAHLLGELARYYRSYVAWQQFKLTVEDDENWCVRQAKLASSRRLMVATAKLAILKAACRAEPLARQVGLLAELLTHPPLERLAHAAPERCAEDVGEVFARAEAFQAILGHRSGRAALLAQSPVTLYQLENPAAYSSAVFNELAAQGRALGDALTRVLLQALADAPPACARTLLV